MNWYLAKIVYQIICGEGHHMPQFDEQLRLIFASDERHALEKAVGIGVQEEEQFFNQQQQLVQWKFVNVDELICMHQLIDGAEVYSQINEVDDGHAYISFVSDKARHIKERLSIVV